MKLFSVISMIVTFFLWTEPSYAATNAEVANFSSQTLTTLIVLASLVSVLFLIKGGYQYITSSGKPDALEGAKITIRNAIIGLVLVLSAGIISSLLNTAFTTPAVPENAQQLQLKPIVPVEPKAGLTQVMLDAINGFLQNVVQSATKPLADGIISFLTTTPSVVSNSVIFNFWLIILGIADALFVLVIAAIGFQFMSASTFGFDELEFKHLLPRLGLAFLGANSSIFLADWIISLCNTLVSALLHATGGIEKAWVLNAVDLLKIIDGDAALITLIFMLLFVILAAVLLLFYIMRLITIALGVVLAPLIFLLWALPRFSDFAEISIRTFLVTVYTVFVHVVIIQLASAFLLLPEQVGTNSLISVLVAIGLLFTLLKTPSFMLQMMFYNTGRGAMRKIGGQIMNVITAKKEVAAVIHEGPIKTPRKVIAA
jgi:hypothetical protein